MKYLHLVQQPQLCSPTCIQMILLRRGKQVEQEDLALAMGVHIRDEEQHLYSNNFPCLPRGDSMLGIKFESFSTEKMSSALAKYDLSYKVYGFKDLSDPKKLVSESLNQGKDVLANFFWKPIRPEKNNGHFVLVEELNENTITVCDPSRSSKPRWDVDLDLFVSCMAEFRGPRKRIHCF